MQLHRFNSDMELYHLDHIARAAGGMINASQITFTGLASLLRTVRVPSSVLGARLDEAERVELLIYENHDPEGCVDLLNETMGQHSSFHLKFGYFVDARVSWDAQLPTNWPDRLEYLNYPLNRAPHLLSVSPCDIVLGNLAIWPDTMLNMDLMLGGVTTTERLLSILEGWDIPREKKFAVRGLILEMESTINRFEQASQPSTEAGAADRAHQSLPANNVVSIVGQGSRRRGHAAS